VQYPEVGVSDKDIIYTGIDFLVNSRSHEEKLLRQENSKGFSADFEDLHAKKEAFH